MAATDLEYRARTRSGCIPPELVSRLLERGHADVVESRVHRRPGKPVGQRGLAKLRASVSGAQAPHTPSAAFGGTK
ncbi:hypothetical protein ACGFR6_36535 [Streptomyces sp. NPDC048567]|uniref:hypothetical protein n=1 Tax=Streptomyces sp. NPDC048567 TaxID=3365570 RepID=UPI00371AEFFC